MYNSTKNIYCRDRDRKKEGGHELSAPQKLQLQGELKPQTSIMSEPREARDTINIL